ncbi:VPLPA-CTERM protein sorting domain-containing protein [Cognatiyoonia koreensis]|uniref:VPLPA-CTERM protein sorting domain-containing protein n=1 Tax=Cognatiyoonia koreensis TaxID=364200 RepID=A0A1I0PUX3_9RHOB|nr:VPLPA-CTERM sorting domain-containing protein [Cognatiyoonia koreensis]SEW18257.1 VPLPA-CTERM protein sorting domain-containing protein [Cognatiyoonia koreensis]
MSFFKTTLLAATTAVLATAGSAATITNGSFEDIGSGTLNNSGWNIFASVPGWTGHPNIEIQSDKTLGSIDAQDGDYYAELDTNQNSTISQDLFLGAGSYILSFYYSPRVNATPTTTNDLVFEVVSQSFGSLLFNSISGAPNPAYPHGKWTQVTANFTLVEDDDVSLFFSAVGEQRTAGCGDCGALIDNVSLSAVPLPVGVLLLLTGLGALGAARRRKTA